MTELILRSLTNTYTFHPNTLDDKLVKNVQKETCFKLDQKGNIDEFVQ